jgi:RNA polymerase sigma-70 factor (ECF subfamily)
MTGSAFDPLLAALAAGDEEAFEKVHKRFAARMFWAALRMLDHRQDAEDLVQQVFADFLRAKAKWAAVNDLSAYLFSSMRRAAYKTAARRRRQPIANSELAADAAVMTAGCMVESPHNERLVRCLAGLPLKQREIIALKIDGELTFAQIGEVLGVSPNTAASRYRLALEKLRTSLGAPKR